MNARQLGPPLVRRPSIYAPPRADKTAHRAKVRRIGRILKRREFPFHTRIIDSENHVIVKPDRLFLKCKRNAEQLAHASRPTRQLRHGARRSV